MGTKSSVTRTEDVTCYKGRHSPEPSSIRPAGQRSWWSCWNHRGLSDRSQRGECCRTTWSSGHRWTRSPWFLKSSCLGWGVCGEGEAAGNANETASTRSKLPCRLLYAPSEILPQHVNYELMVFGRFSWTSWSGDLDRYNFERSGFLSVPVSVSFPCEQCRPVTTPAQPTRLRNKRKERR